MPIRDHNTFVERYQIMSTRGRYYGRKRLIDSVTRTLGRQLVTRAEVTALIDDDAWMIRRRGVTPSALASDAYGRICSDRAARGQDLWNDDA